MISNLVRVRARARVRVRVRVGVRVGVRGTVRVRVRVRVRVIGLARFDGLVAHMRLLFMNSNLLWSAKAWLFITFSICAVQP